MKTSCLLIVGLVVACVSPAQETDALPAFEAASLKLLPPVPRGGILVDPIGEGLPVFRPVPHMEGGPGTKDPGQLRCTHCTLAIMVATAYNVGLFEIRSARTIDPGEYDLAAKVPPDSTRQQVQLMLRRLLAERFQLSLHTEKQEATAYALVAGKPGPRFPQSSDEPEQTISAGPTLHATLRDDGLYTLTGQDRSMKELADALSTVMKRPVIDMTGLKGNYVFLIAWMASERLPQPKRSTLPAGIESAPYSLQVAVQSQLGLKLDVRKMAVEVLIIDSALKAPIAN